jgi:hypothetical protein
MKSHPAFASVQRDKVDGDALIYEAGVLGLFNVFERNIMTTANRNEVGLIMNSVVTTALPVW